MILLPVVLGVLIVLALLAWLFVPRKSPAPYWEFHAPRELVTSSRSRPCGDVTCTVCSPELVDWEEEGW